MDFTINLASQKLKKSQLIRNLLPLDLNLTNHYPGANSSEECKRCFLEIVFGHAKPEGGLFDSISSSRLMKKA